eukprot:3420311-Amphidinium_carterae.1
MSPPQDRIIDQSGCWEKGLYQITSNTYGLPDAPVVFGKQVREKLLRTSALTHPMDCCCFMWRHEGVLCGVAIIHVDDFLLIHRGDFKQHEAIHSSFTWGSWKTFGAQRP